MPIQFPTIQPISWDEANPYLKGAQVGQQLMQNYMQFPQDLQKAILANKISQVQAQYAQPMAQQALTKEQQYNQMYIPDIQSQIGLRGSQSDEAKANAAYKNAGIPYVGGLANAQMAEQYASAKQNNAQTAKINYMLAHPGLMGGESAKDIQALKDLGYLGTPNSGQTNPSNSNQVQQNTSGNGGIGISPSNVGSNSVPSNQQNYPSQSMIPNSDNGDNGNVLFNPQMGNALSRSPIQQNQPISPNQQVQVNQQPQQSQQAQLAKQIAQPGNNLGIDPAPFKTGNAKVDSIMNKPYAAAAYQQKMTNAFDWVHSTPDQKSYEVAQLAGAGIDPSEAVALRTKGMTVPQILQSKGFDPTNPPDPDFLPTRGNIQQLKTRQAALKEVETINKFVAEGLGPYSQTIFGMSPLQIKDALTGMNKDQQIKFLAARQLAPEAANIRLVIAQGKAGITAVNEIEHKSMLNIEPIRSFVTPDVWEASQKLTDDQLRESLLNAEKVYSVARNKGNSSSSSSSNVKKFVFDGNKLVPQ